LAIASLLVSVGTLLALSSWLTTDTWELFAAMEQEQIRSALSILVLGVPVTVTALIGERLARRLPPGLGIATLLGLLAPISALLTGAALLLALLPSEWDVPAQVARSLVGVTALLLLARIVVRFARRSPDWLSIISVVFALGLLPVGALSITAQQLVRWNYVGMGMSTAEAPTIVIHLTYLALLLPALFFGRALVLAEVVRYRVAEAQLSGVLAAFGTGTLSALLTPVAVGQTYDALQRCTGEYSCARPPGEWVVIGLMSGVTAWLLIRAAERSKLGLLWIGALPPVIVTAIAINWYLPAELSGLPIAGTLIVIGGLVLLRRATMNPASQPRPMQHRRKR
jgi:hypothetical protein